MPSLVPHTTGASRILEPAIQDPLAFQVTLRDGRVQVRPSDLRPLPKKKRNKPLLEKAGSVAIPIYKTRWTQKRTRRTYVSHTIIWRDLTGEHREKHSDLPTAQRRAQQIAKSIANGETSMLSFTPADKASYLRAAELVRSTGKPLELAAAIYTECVQILDGIATPEEACRFYKAQHPAGVVVKSSADIVTELFSKRKVCGKWQRVLQKMLDRFAGKFPGPLNTIVARDLDDWLDTLKAKSGRTVGLRTRRNYREAIADLCRFAKDRGYLARDWNRLAAVSDPEPPRVEVNLYTPDELLYLLTAAESYDAGRKLVPLITITAFAGVRHGEMNEEKIAHLDWADLDFEEKAIFVDGKVSKTGNPRVADMPDNLIAWLEPYRRTSGKICALENTSNALGRLRAKAVREILKEAGNLANTERATWLRAIAKGLAADKKNALRKSFISYKDAQTGNTDHVAALAGNSSGVIRSNYLRVTTKMKREAKRWFTLMPDRADVLPLFTWAQGA